MNCSPQAPLSMGFPRQEYWRGLPFASPGEISNPGIQPTVSCIVVWFFTAEPPGEALKRDLDKHKDVQAGFRKGRETRDQIANICWIMGKSKRIKQKNIYFCFIDYAKAIDCVDHNKLWKILKEMRIPDHLTCLLRNLYAGQEATVKTVHGTRDWF